MKTDNEYDNGNLVIVGLNSENKNEESLEEIYEEGNNERDEEENNERDEEENNEQDEEENSEYEDANMEETYNENYRQSESNYEFNTVENQETMEISVETVEERSKGRPRGTTKEVMQVRRRLEQIEVRRSERIRNQHAMRIQDEEIPKTVEEAKRSSKWEHWNQAMDEEMASMKKHEVWEIIFRPKRKKIIKCKWVFSIKEDRTLEQDRRYKARLVAMWCGQRLRFDYHETFAPTVRIETIRLLFSLCTEKKRKMKMYDVKTAFFIAI